MNILRMWTLKWYSVYVKLCNYIQRNFEILIFLEVNLLEINENSSLKWNFVAVTAKEDRPAGLVRENGFGVGADTRWRNT